MNVLQVSLNRKQIEIMNVSVKYYLNYLKNEILDVLFIYILGNVFDHCVICFVNEIDFQYEDFIYIFYLKIIYITNFLYHLFNNCSLFVIHSIRFI